MNRWSYFWIILLAIGCHSCSLNRKIIYRSNQLGACSIYTYRAEAVGYSDLGLLALRDTGNRPTPFFSRLSLQSFESLVEVKVKKTLLRQTDAGSLFSIELLNPKLTFLTQGSPVTLPDTFVNALKRPLFIQTGLNGRINGIRLYAGLSESIEDIVKDIVSDIQFVTADTSSVRWQSLEQNLLGDFYASYQLVSEREDSLYFDKRNLGYVWFKGQRKGNRITVNQVAQVSTNRAYQLLNVFHSANYAILTTTQDTIVLSGTRKNISRDSFFYSNKALARDLRLLEQQAIYCNYQPLSSPLADSQIYRRTYLSTLRNDTYESLVLQLRMTERLSEAEQFELIKKIRAFAYLHPSACGPLGEMLVRAEVSTIYYKILLSALSSTGTEASIDALAKAVGDRFYDEVFCQNLLPFLATTKTPTRKAVSILQYLLTKNIPTAYKNTLELTLGGMTYKFRDRNAFLADSLFQYLDNRLKNSPDTIQQLLVLGNTGMTKALGVIRSYLFDNQTTLEVKSYAINALRFIAGAEVDRLLGLFSNSLENTLSEKAKEIIQFRKSYLVPQ